MNLYVLTSNAYHHCLPGFAYLFNKFWGTHQAVTIVGFDAKPPGLPQNFRFWSLGKQDDFTWSEGVIALCKRIPDQVFMLMLEDYFLCAPVDTARIYRLYDLMNVSPRIVKIDLTDDRLKVPHESCENVSGLICSADTAPYQTSLQAAIWRKDFLTAFLEPSENPWQFEKKGTTRVKRARKAGTFTGHILGCERPPMQYVNAIGGEGSHPGEWARKRFPHWLWFELEARKLVS